MTSRYPGGLIRKNAANTAITGASGVWDLGSQAQAVKNNTWPIAGVSYPVSGSLRFRASASAYLSRTPSATGSQTTWTWSGWVKQSSFGTDGKQWLLTSGNSGSIATNYTFLSFSAQGFSANGDQLQFFSALSNSTVFAFESSARFRDPSAWYHVVAAIDTTQATASNRIKLYINGVQITAFATATYPAQNTSIPFINSSSYETKIGSIVTYGFFDGYMAEINFVDGQALTPASFGQTSPITGVWEPIKYTGTYGTNGYYLSLSDTSSIGKDFSGNGNNWTPNNISTTNDSTFDLMSDVPTQWAPQSVTDVGGTVRGNYCTLNPLNKSGGMTLSEGNLRQSMDSASGYSARGTIAASSGKWYAEAFLQNRTIQTIIGVCDVTMGAQQDPIVAPVNAVGYYGNNGNKYVNGTSSAYGASYATNDIIGIALDMDGLTVTFYKNNVSQGSIALGTTGLNYTFFGSDENYLNTQIQWNFGQRPFTYTPPTGFKTLCTTNLPTPTIGATTTTAANKYFDATTYTGTGATLSVTNAGGFQPDFVWLKSRSAATNHHIYDAVRGATKVLVTNTTEPESTSANTITSFNSGGFTVGTNTAINTSSATYVAWQWNAGGSTVTNTTGSISAQVRANPTAGFSVATFTGNGTAGATVGHGLGVAPSMIMFKERSSGTSGLVWHTGYGTNQGQMLIDSTAAIYNPGNGLYFNSTYPSSTVVTLGTSGATNGNGSTYVLYSWAAIAGFSAFGSYTGNGSTDGPFIFTGFRPKWIMIKRSSGIEDWRIIDSSRSSYNIQGATLYPNTNGAENSGQLIDINSNGFKCRTTDVAVNGSGSTYIYAAFAETPFKYALAR